MNLWLVATVVYTGIWLNHTIYRMNKKEKKIKQSFWDRESQANGTRKADLSGLDYIQIPENILELTPELRPLQDARIVNLTGLSNTDLKLSYGAANLSRLTEYDQNYTVLATTLQRSAEGYFLKEQYREAAFLLDFAVSTGTDITDSYRLLTALYIYHLDLTPEELYQGIQELLQRSASLRSLSKASIRQFLESALESPEAVTDFVVIEDKDHKEKNNAEEDSPAAANAPLYHHMDPEDFGPDNSSAAAYYPFSPLFHTKSIEKGKDMTNPQRHIRVRKGKRYDRFPEPKASAPTSEEDVAAELSPESTLPEGSSQSLATPPSPDYGHAKRTVLSEEELRSQLGFDDLDPEFLKKRGD